MVVEQQAEDRRGQREAGVQARVDGAIDAAGGAGGRGALDQHVAGRPGQAGAEAGQRDGGCGRQPGQPAGAGQHQQQSGQRHRRGDGALEPLDARHQEAADHHADRTAQHVAGHHEGGQRFGQAVHPVQRRAGEALHRAQRGGRPEEEREAQPDRGQLQEGHRMLFGRGHGAGSAGRAGRRSACSRTDCRAGPVIQIGAPQPQHRQHHDSHQRRAQIGRAPAVEGATQADQEDRRQRPAQIAADAMHREGMAEPLRRDPPVQDGEVGRMKRRVAQTGQRGGQHQSAVALRQRTRQRSQQEADQRAEQHRPGAHPVDQEA